MIREKSLHAVMQLADNYAANGYELYPVNGSPLVPVCRTSNPLNVQIKDLSSDAFAIPSISKTRLENGEVPHDVRMEEAVEFAAEVVRNNLKLARTVVNPIVLRALENIEAKLNKDQQILSQPLTVVQYHYHKLWDNPLLESMVSRYEGTPAFQIEQRNGMPKLAADQIEEHLKLDISRYDEDMSDLVDGYSPEWLEAVYSAGFLIEENEMMVEMGVPPLTSMIQNSGTYPDELAVIFTLARSFLDSAPEGAAMGLDVYRDWMATVVSQTGRAIVRVMDRRESERNRKILVRRWPIFEFGILRDEGGEIVVNGEVYNRWLEEGGTPEALMGAAVTDKESGYTTLIEKVETYENNWKRQERILSSEVRFDRFNRTVSGIEKAISYEINTFEHGEPEAADARKIQQHSELKRHLKDLTGRLVDEHNLYATVRSLICKIMFPRTEAERILSAIDSAAAANPGIDVREAAFLAVIEVVSEWVGCQIEVENY